MDWTPTNHEKGDWEDWMDIRLNELENQYESQHVTDFDKATLEKIRLQLCKVLGPRYAEFLEVYTDRLIAVYNRDGDWFYKKGWQDAMQVLEDAPIDWYKE